MHVSVCVPEIFICIFMYGAIERLHSRIEVLFYKSKELSNSIVSMSVTDSYTALHSRHPGSHRALRRTKDILQFATQISIVIIFSQGVWWVVIFLCLL